MAAYRHIFAFIGLMGPPGAAMPEPATIQLRGQTFTVYPREKLSERGLAPPEIAPEENAAWVYIEAFNAAVDLPPDLQADFDRAVDGEWPDGEAGARLAEWLDSNRTAIDLALRAADMPEYYMPFFRGDSDVLLAALLPTLAHHRQMARMLAADAARLKAGGDADAAIGHLVATQRMAHQVGNGKTLIEGLVGYAVAGLAERNLLQFANDESVPADAIAQAAGALEELEASFPSFDEMVLAEGEWATSFVDDVMTAPGTLQILGMASVGEMNPGPRGPWDKFAESIRRLYLPDRGIKRRMRQHYQTLAAATRVRDDGSVGTIEEDKLFENIPAWDVASRLILPSLSRAHEMALQAQSNYIRTRINLAAEAFRRRNGRPPASLGELTPDYLSHIPADPMTGYDFEYAPSADAASLPLITSRNEADALRQKRRTPAILSPRESRWRRYVHSVAARYDFSDAQNNAAMAILRDVESRAAAFERGHGATLKSLVEAGPSPESARALAPLDELFNELKTRLDRLPTAGQRESARSGRSTP